MREGLLAKEFQHMLKEGLVNFEIQTTFKVWKGKNQVKYRQKKSYYKKREETFYH